ncbi:MAG: twin-arginine translocase subunit TatC [Actinomycetes bacterium]
MTLVEHLRELRTRLVKAVLAIVVCAVVGWYLFDPIFSLLKDPFLELPVDNKDLDTRLTLSGITDPFFLRLKIALMVGVILASPVWLYQLWAFIMPGLHRTERRWSLLFLGTAVPLFLAGVGLAYVVLPKGLSLLIGFTPTDVSNFVQVDGYLSFVIRLTLAFGLAFELPVFIVMLNLAGVVSAASLRRRRAVIVFAVFVFAAVATPTGDPVTMLSLGLPMVALFEGSVLVARFVDRRRARMSGEPDYEAIGDDETSAVDTRPSRLDDDTPATH